MVLLTLLRATSNRGGKKKEGWSVAAIYAKRVRSHWLSLCSCVIRKYSVSLSHARCHGSALTEERGRKNAAPVTLPTLYLLERHLASAATSASSQEESDSVSVACGWGEEDVGGGSGRQDGNGCVAAGAEP